MFNNRINTGVFADIYKKFEKISDNKNWQLKRCEYILQTNVVSQLNMAVSCQIFDPFKEAEMSIDQEQRIAAGLKNNFQFELYS